MSNLKVEGKVADFCPKCKNCKSTTRGYDGKKDWLTEVKCEDPYDGMIKTLDADSDICCSMFEPKTDIIYEDDKVRGIKVTGWGDEKVTILKSNYDNLMDKVYKYDELKEKNDKDVMYSLHLGYELNKMKSRYETECKNSSNIVEENVELEREKAELIKASKRKDELIQYYREKLKKANDEINLLNSKLDKLGEYYRTDEKLIDNIQNVIFPQEEGSDYTYGYEEILNKVKDILNANKGLTDKIGSLKNKIVTQQSTHYKQCGRILELENMVSKLQSGEYDDILAKDVEIKSLQAKYEDAMAGWKDAIDTNDKQFEELTRRYNMIAKKLNDIHDILKEDPNNE